MFSRPIAFPCLKGNAKKRREKSPEHCKLATEKTEHYEKPKHYTHNIQWKI